ncbi:MAG: hypothetical protein ABW003_09510 [Microvirga sp.]
MRSGLGKCASEGIAPAFHRRESLVPRYHFNVYDGVTLLDKKGVELPDTMFARREAIRYAGVLLEEGARLESLGQEWRMEVTDGTELILFRLDFFVTPSAAVTSLEKP